MSVWELYTQLFARNWRYGRFAQSLSQGCSEKIRKKDVDMTAGRWPSWSIQIPQFLMHWWPAMKAGSTAMTQRPRDRVPSGSMLALPDPRRSDRATPSTNFWWSLFFWQHCLSVSLCLSLTVSLSLCLYLSLSLFLSCLSLSLSLSLSVSVFLVRDLVG